MEQTVCAMRRAHARAFTLIELLIVVAIIAILAAIAVPNFLEAQVRAKASRAKSDMRTAITAIEAYAVDAGKYPVPRYIEQQANPYDIRRSAVQFLPGGTHPYIPPSGGAPPTSPDPNNPVGGLTSPIAYIT